MNTIPLLPNLISISLQDDFIHFVSEVKFLLLFFEKPHLILHSHGHGYLNPSVIARIKAGTTDAELEDLRQSISHLDYLRHEEWDELVSLCDASYMVVSAESGLEQSAEYRSVAARVEEVLSASGFSCPGFYKHIMDGAIPARFRETVPALQVKGDTEKVRRLLFTLHMGMFRLVGILDECSKLDIPIIWSECEETVLCKLYGDYLIEKMKSSSETAEAKGLLRQLRGDQLLSETQSLSLVNVAAIPLDRILEFRTSNADLLETFLTYYRDFLTAIQVTPSESEELALQYGQKLASSLNMINNEMIILSDKAKIRWMGRVSEHAAECAKTGTAVANLNFFSTPFALLASGAAWIAKTAGGGAVALAEHEAEKRRILVRSNAGYLWKATKEFA